MPSEQYVDLTLPEFFRKEYVQSAIAEYFGTADAADKVVPEFIDWLTKQKLPLNVRCVKPADIFRFGKGRKHLYFQVPLAVCFLYEEFERFGFPVSPASD